MFVAPFVPCLAAAWIAAAPLSPTLLAAATPSAEPDTVVMHHDPLKYQMVVSATRISKPSESIPQSTAIVTGAELRRRGTRTVAEALQDVVGVDTGEGSDNGPRLPNIGLWGLKEFDALLITIDGVPVGGPFNPNLAEIPVEDIDRIEVSKGPQGTLYGVSGFAGMVQIFTRAEQGDHGHVTGGLASFSDGHGSGAARFAAGGFQFQAKAAVQRSDYWLERTGSEIDRGALTATHAVGKGALAIDVSETRDTQRWGTPRPYDEDNGVPFDGFLLERNYAVGGARLDHHLTVANSDLKVPLGEQRRFENTLGWSHDRQNQVRSFPEPDSLGPDGMFPSEGVALRPRETDVFEDARLISNFALRGEHELVTGAAVTWGRTLAEGNGFDFDQAIDDPTSIPDVGAIPAGDDRSFEDRRTFFGVYAHDSWTPMKALTVAGGGRFDATEEKLHAQALELSTQELAVSDDSRNENAWSGDISALVKLLPNETPRIQAANLYVAWKSSFKPAAPNLTEAEAARILDPERTHSIEGGVKTRWFERQVSLDLSLFQMDFDNLVVSTLDAGGQPLLENAGRERFKGYEAELGLAPDFAHGTSLTVGYAHHDARFVNFTDISPEGQVEDFGGHRLELVPQDQVNTKLDYVGPRGIGVFGALRWAGKRALNRDNTHFADPYTEVDAGASLDYHEIRVSVVGRNLGDDRHPVTESEIGDSQLYIAPPRRVTAEVTYRF